jgi:hypothetical protein
MPSILFTIDIQSRHHYTFFKLRTDVHKNALNTLEFSMEVNSTHFNWYGVAVLSMYLTKPNTIILNRILNCGISVVYR